MKLLQLAVAILSLIVIQIESQNEIGCGQRLVPHQPLMTNAFPSQHFPWHAVIYHRVENSVPQYRCGGTVISSKLILTAATCLWMWTYNAPMETKQVSVSLGRLNLNVNESSAQNLEVSELILHPNFTSIDLSNDIAIIRLATEATFNNYVRPICLWNANRTDLADIIGKTNTVIGWGLTETGELSNVLRQASMPVVPYITCVRSNVDFFGHFLTETSFCAGARNGTSACRGDTGGSMTFLENGSYYIRGIVSMGPAILNTTTQEMMCDSSQFTVFTDVAQFLPWIDEVANERKTRA